MFERRMFGLVTEGFPVKWAAALLLAVFSAVSVVASLGTNGVQARRSSEPVGSGLAGAWDKGNADTAKSGRHDNPADRKAPRVGQQAKSSQLSKPALRIINPGTIDEDPARLETVARQQQGIPVAATADDDLDAPGTIADWYEADSETFRTVCVRLCDGALTPMSFATTRDRFGRDALRCDRSCSSPSRLYVQRNPGTDAEQLSDLNGQSYAALDTAFRFRTSYDAACTCRAHSWETLARAKHRLFTLKERVDVARSMTLGPVSQLKVAMAEATASDKRPAATGRANLASQRRVAVAVLPPRENSLAQGANKAEQPEPEVENAASRGRSSAAVTRPNKQATSKGPKSAKRSAAKQKAKTAPSTALVLFSATIEGTARPLGKSKHALQADFSPNRRFDGTDWRMNTYEPL